MFIKLNGINQFPLMKFVESGLSGLNDIVDTGIRAIDPQAGARAAEKATGQQLGFQQEALDYIKATEELPLELRDQALTQLAGFYGLGGDGDFMSSPYYQQALEQSEDAILRQAGATGGLRSGNVQQALASNTQGLMDRFLSGIRGFTGAQPTQAPGQLNLMGQTQAAGTIGQQQNLQSGFGNFLNTAGQLYAAFSDIRLKKNIEPMGQYNSINLYRWEWNDKAKELGLEGEGYGVMAGEQDIENLILDESSGYLMVNYGKVFH